ncbi:hypothetical protein GCM10027416_05750 [Okibacterium endophyticum]
MQPTRVLAPRALSQERLWASGVGTFALFVAIAGDGWRNLLGIWGFTALAVVTCAVCVVTMVRRSRRDLLTFNVHRQPKALVAFMALAVVSLAWSAYASGTAIALVGMALGATVGVYAALALSWPMFLRSFANAIKWMLGLSLAFELWVSLVVGQPVLPLWVEHQDDPPLLSMWSRNLLFEGGRIQGVVGNSNLLGVVALFGIIVFSIQLASRRSAETAPGRGHDRRSGTRGNTVDAVTTRADPSALHASIPLPSRAWGIFWIVLAVVMFALTRSSTMIIAAVVALVVLAAALLIRRTASPRQRTSVYLGLLALAAAGLVTVSLAWSQLLEAFGKSADLTGRLDIWATVTEMAVERPWFGWGYSSPWVPWVEPFNDLVRRNGVLQLHAHNAWLDVWMQLGVVGVVVFAAAVMATLGRAWFQAVDRPRFDLRDDRSYEPISLFPLLIMTVLLVQTFTESRILFESGWVLLVAFALATKQRCIISDSPPDGAVVR